MLLLSSERQLDDIFRALTNCFLILDAIRHLQGTITKVVASQKSPNTTPKPPGPTSSPNPVPTATTSQGPNTKSTTTQNNYNAAPKINFPFYLIVCSNIILAAIRFT